MIQKAIYSLNMAFRADPKAIRELCSFRVRVEKEELVEHPWAQIGRDENGDFIRFIGLLNAAIEPITGTRIAEKRDDATGELIGFCEFK